MKSITEFSVKNSLLINLITLIIFIGGYFAIKNLNREAFPNIDFDIVQISTAYPGSSPEEVEQLITIPIEKELKTVDDLKEVSSVSTEGLSLIVVQLDENLKDKQSVINDIQRAVDSVEDFPQDLPSKPLVRDIKTKDSPVIELSLSGDLHEKDLREYALALEKQILDLPDVSAVARKGLRDREIWVEIAPQQMESEHISLNEIVTALKLQNTSLPGGKYYDQNNVEYIIKTSGSFKNKEDVANTILRSSTLGQSVKLSDVATIKEEFAEETLINKTEGLRSIILTVIKKEKGDAITLVENLKTLAQNFKNTTAPKLEINTVNDLSYYIKRRLNVLINNGLIGLVMVAICLFTFLSLGAAISACLGIPTALLVTFIVMNFLGISINLLSLFGLIMVLGMLVDEDIVIAENMHRHIEEGNQDIQSASIKGAQEVSLPVISTVLTTIVVFIPIFFMDGIMGKFTRHIPMVIMITLMASLLEALFILPAHIAHISEIMHNFENKWRKRFPLKKPARHRAYAFLDTLQAGYKKILVVALKHRYIFLFVLLGLFVGSQTLVAKNFHKFQLFPSKGIEKFFIRAEAEVGTSLEEMANKMVALETLVSTLSANELDTYTTEIGLQRNDPTDPNTKRGSHYAQISIYLTPETKRTRHASDILKSLREQSKQISGFKNFTFDEVRNGPPSGSPIAIRLRGEHFDVLQTIADQYKSELSQIEGVYDVQDDYNLDKDEVHVKVDAQLASQMGLSVSAIASSVRYAFAGIEATHISTSEDEVGVVVKFPVEYRSQITSLENLLIQNQKGKLIPLKAVAHFEKIKTAQSILHYKNSRNVNVTANIDAQKIGILEVQNILSQKLHSLSSQYPNYSMEFGGEGKRSVESLQSLMQAFIISIILILVILIATFRSFILPLVNGLIIPFTMIGVVVAFELHGENLSFMAILGLVALTGIVVDAGTIMIEFIHGYQREGHSLHEAVMKGAIVRFRAVVLITITTVMGLLPSAYGFGGSDPFIAPMAMALNYGMIFSTVLTLIYVPIFLFIINDIKNFFTVKIGQFFSK